MTTIGIDMGGVDRDVADWHAARAAGASFVYLRKTYHLRPDLYYQREAHRAREAGLVVGAYHFPDWRPTGPNAKTQIAAFKNAPGDIFPGKDLPPVIDVEGGRAGWDVWGRSKSELVEFIRQLVLEVEDQLGVTPGIYTSYVQYDALGRPAMPWAVRCPLWVKTAYRLRAREPVDQVAPHEPHVGLTADDHKNFHRIPDPWTESGWTIQQYQGDATGFPGFSRTVDMNRFNTLRHGSKGPFVKWLQRKLSAVQPSKATTTPQPQVPHSAAPPDSDVHASEDALLLTNGALVGTLIQDGDFGPKTDAAVRAFQAAHSLDVDGIVGPGTFAALAWTRTDTRTR